MTTEMIRIPTEIVIGESPPENAAAIPATRLEREVLKWHRKAWNGMATSVANGITCGYLLCQIKDGMKHGAFTAWVRKKAETEIGFGMRTVQRYMRVAKDFIEFVKNQGHVCETERDLELCVASAVLTEFNASKQEKQAARRLTQSDLNDWLTPAAVRDAVRTVLGDLECDPCALSDEWDVNLAEINISPKQNGLSDEIPWGRTAWVCPGHKANWVPWFEKTKLEFMRGHLEQAVFCVPVSGWTFPKDLQRYPIAITPEPMIVTTRRSGQQVQQKLPTRSLFIYLTSGSPDVEHFALAFRDIAVVFAPISLDA